MTNINLDLATKLDGSETHMLAILVDSWGDKLIVHLNHRDHDFAADYYMPCARCGNAVLECNFEAGMDTCDRCNAGPKHIWMPTKVKVNSEITELLDDMGAIPKMAEVKNLREVKMKTLRTVKSETTVIVNEQLDFEERLTIALEGAEFAFWDVIARSYPEAVSGDYLMEDISVTCRPNVRHWLDNNLPSIPQAEPSYRGDKLDLKELNLHYLDTWHLMHTGGGCMVALTDNVGENHNYMGVNSECVCIYTDTFNQDDFMMEHIASWSFGDNPTVLMNIIDEYMGGVALWDTGKLFDDIMTIAKSGKC